MTPTYELVIRPRKGWQAVNFRELWLYRELLGFLVWRDIKIRYKQTLLGGLWAILQPLVAMLVFTVFFNRLAGISSDGPPYPLFVYAALIPWMFFSSAVTASSNSLVGNQQLISKVYFPRMFLPLGSVGALIVDMLVSLALVFALMIHYRWPVSLKIIWLPVFILGCFLATSGTGLALAALNVMFRDVKYAAPYFIQILMFVTPVIYPLSYVPARFRYLMGLNPLTGVIEGFRYSLLGSPARWDVISVSLATSVALFIAAVYLFVRMERMFADVV